MNQSLGREHPPWTIPPVSTDVLPGSPGRFLLDTNAIAAILEGRISASLARDLQAASDIAASTISLFQIGQKVRLGKWDALIPHLLGLTARLQDDGIRLVPSMARSPRSPAPWTGSTVTRSTASWRSVSKHWG